MFNNNFQRIGSTYKSGNNSSFKTIFGKVYSSDQTSLINKLIANAKEHVKVTDKKSALGCYKLFAKRFSNVDHPGLYLDVDKFDDPEIPLVALNVKLNINGNLVPITRPNEKKADEPFKINILQYADDHKIKVDGIQYGIKKQTWTSKFKNPAFILVPKHLGGQESGEMYLADGDMKVNGEIAELHFPILVANRLAKKVPVERPPKVPKDPPIKNVLKAFDSECHTDSDKCAACNDSKSYSSSIFLGKEQRTNSATFTHGLGGGRTNNNKSM